jgi:hypothetical protein
MSVQPRGLESVLRMASPSIDGADLTDVRAIAAASLRISNMLSMPPSSVLLTSTATMAIAAFWVRESCGQFGRTGRFVEQESVDMALLRQGDLGGSGCRIELRTCPPLIGRGFDPGPDIADQQAMR